MIKHVIIEGIDRLGKDTLIQGIQSNLGFCQVLHYQKPIVLKKYYEIAHDSSNATSSDDNLKSALVQYQAASFRAMFSLLHTSSPTIICNRAHLGETVYAPRYRKYSGDYVFDIESSFDFAGGPLEKTLLVMLFTTDFSIVSDDGQSFDVTKREEEQADFLKAYERSKIKNRMKIDVSNGNGRFIRPEYIVDLVCNKLR